jgi:hypothetical protein
LVIRITGAFRRFDDFDQCGRRGEIRGKGHSAVHLLSL